MRRTLPLLLPAALTACISIGPAPDPTVSPVTQQAWWRRLAALCGGSYPGRVVERGASGESFEGQPLVLRAARCTADTVDLAFDVGAERTRTWRITRESRGLRLRHLNAGATGGENDPTDYGGVTLHGGDAEQQDFQVDAATVRMLPRTEGNVWSLELLPAGTLAYTLGRPGVGRRFRLEFDVRRAPRR